jgi:hypothetical protein
MTELRSTLQRRILCAARFLRRGFVACVFTGLVAIAALAQTAPAQEVTVTLLPSHTCTDATATPCGDLKVTDSNANYEGKPLGRTASWLYFDASALPKDNEISITRARLQLVRKTGEGLNRGMVIRVLSAEASPSGGAAPSSYKDGVEVASLQSDRRTCPDPLRCSDSARWSAKPPEKPNLADLLRKDSKGVPYIGLLLIPSDESASSRVYYGLRSDESGKGKDSEAGYQPRLMLTYRYNSQPSFGCTSEPLALARLANLQSEGGPAHISGCEFISKDNSPRQDKYAPLKIAVDSLTVTPAVYGDLIFVVRNNKWSDCPGPEAEKPKGAQSEAVCLEARKPLGGVVWKAWVDAKGEVLETSRMVVNRFGRLRIVTGNAIYSFQLKPKQTCPDPRTKKTVAFGAPPAAVVEGLDGTLYIVSKGIFALNPDFAPLDSADHPRKLWWITLGNAASADARITLSPDGQFLYALALLSDESKFLVINAQTGKDVDLIHEVPDPKFPTKLLTLYHPVVARHEDGADYVFIAGNLGTGGVLWGVKNKPILTRGGDYQAKLTKVWMNETDGKIGQPILDPIPDRPADLSAKKLYFLISRTDTSEFRAVGALNGKTVNAWSGTGGIDIRGTPFAANNSIDGNPVVDSAGNVMFWADDTFYGFSAEPRLLFNPKLPELGKPQLLFGPGGTLYAASGATVSALIPLFNLDTVGSIRKIESPTNLQVTGTATAGAPWELEARGSVIHGNGFQVQKGATLSVKVPGEPPSLSALGEMPCACANANAPPPQTVITWISGRKFDEVVVGQQILVGWGFGLHTCTVESKTGDTSVTCKENLGPIPAGSFFSNRLARVRTNGNRVIYKTGAKFKAIFADGAFHRDFFISLKACTPSSFTDDIITCNENQGHQYDALAYRVQGKVSGSPLKPSTPDDVCK